MVSAESTARKYAGKMAENYESLRIKKQRWLQENEIVEAMLQSQKDETVLDIPVGTGRFLVLYNKLGLKCYGYDTSKAMLSLAKRKHKMLMSPKRLKRIPAVPLVLEIGDIRKIPHQDRSIDVAVCVRFLDLVPQDTMEDAMHELCRVTRYRIILTIRLGEEYVAKSNTATHDKRRFMALIKRLGWQMLENKPIFRQGWHVLHLGRKNDGRR